MVNPINQYATLKDFTDAIDTSNAHLAFRIMGKKSSSGPYYTASMLAAVYNEIGDPDSSLGYQTIPTPFGEILRRGCNLWGGKKTYSQSLTPNAKSKNNIFQADLIEMELSSNGKAFPQNKLAMVLTHSCGIDNSDRTNIIPVYLESELTDSVITRLRGSPPKDFSAVRGNWLSNENVNFLGLPAMEIAGLNDDGDRMLACLNLSMLVPKDKVPKIPKLRLTYSALSYFQLRIALLYIRDVQDSDDTRDM